MKNDVTRAAIDAIDVALRKIEAAAYLRYSEDKLQRESSIEDQLRECLEKAVADGCEIPNSNIFKDPGYRGADHNRPDLQRLLAIIESGQATFKVLYVADWSRISRDRELSERLLKAARTYRIRLVGVEDDLDSDQAGFEANHMLKSFVSSNNAKEVAAKVKRGGEGRFLKGKVPSGKTFGYDHECTYDDTRKGPHGTRFVVDVDYIINQEQAAVIILIFELYRDGLGYSAIAKELNTRGIQSPRKSWKKLTRGWNHSAVRNILENSRYIGRAVRNKTETYRLREGQIRHRAMDPSKWLHSEHFPNQQIVSDVLWEAVRRVNLQRQQQSGHRKGAQNLGGGSRTTASRSYLFSSICICSCTGSMRLFSGSDGYYHCDNYRRGIRDTEGNPVCTNKLRIKRKDLEQHLVEQMVAALRQDFTVDQLVAAVTVEVQKELQRLKRLEAAAQDRSTLMRRQVVLQAAVNNLLDAIAELGNTTLRSGKLIRTEAELEEVTAQLDAKPRVFKQYTNMEVREQVRHALDDIAQVILGEPKIAKQELMARITSLTLTPTTDDGAPAYLVTGDMHLFPENKPVMLPCTGPNTAELHNLVLRFDGTVLYMDDRGCVVRVHRQYELASLRPGVVEIDATPAYLAGVSMRSNTLNDEDLQDAWEYLEHLVPGSTELWGFSRPVA